MDYIYYGRFSELYFLFPKSVQVAVSIDCHGLLIAKKEADGGVLAGIKVSSLYALVALKLYPEDAVLLGHRMDNRAYNYVHSILKHLDLGDVLFSGRLYNTCLEDAHLLATAMGRNAGRVYHFYDITALFANIKFILRHNQFSFRVVLL